MTVVGIHQPQYLPWLGLIDRVYRCDAFVILDSVPYSKNYFYNRNKIKTSDGIMWLTIPVLTKGHYGQAFTETRIDKNQDWGAKHWKSISYSYGNASFFKDYSEYFFITMQKQWTILADICVETFTFLLKSFNINTKVVRSSELSVNGKKEELLINICKKMGATHYLSGIDGKNYLDMDLWKEYDIQIDFQNYAHPAYPQLYGDFVSNLSAIDLLFNCGEKGLETLTANQPKYFGGLR